MVWFLWAIVIGGVLFWAQLLGRGVRWIRRMNAVRRFEERLRALEQVELAAAREAQVARPAVAGRRGLDMDDDWGVS